MPVIKSAIKKLRQDRTRTERNDLIRKKLSLTLRRAKRVKKPENLSEAFSVIDRAAKNGITHKNRARRLKSALSKLSKNPPEKSKSVKVESSSSLA